MALSSLTSEGRRKLVERDRELELIDDALIGAELGRGRVVLLYGPAGVGRSALLRASALDAQARGIDVLEASGDELERGYGFGVVRQLLEIPIASLSGAQRRSVLRDVGPAAESALGIAGSERHGSSTAFEQIEGVYHLITRLATLKPLLVAVDDLQWCDRPSLDFLCFLGHRANRLPVTIIAAWRRGEPGVRAGRLQALAGKPETLFLTLGPLSRDGVRTLIQREAGSEPDDEVAALIHGMTGGHSFLVAELLAGLGLRGFRARAACRETIEAVTPESVRRHVVARLGRHPEAVRRFAEALAVLGNGSLGEVAALAEIDQDRARAAAAALVRAGILGDDPVIAYAYPLLRAAVYDTLSSLECADLHRRAAALLCADGAGADPAGLERVAEHVLASEPAGDPRLAQVLLKVASRSVDRGELEDAQRCLERALGEIGDSSTRVRVLVQLAELELHAGDPASASVHALEGLALASVPAERALAAIACAQIEFAVRGWTGAVMRLESEAGSIPDDDRGPELDVKAAAATLRVCANQPPWDSHEAPAEIEALAGTIPAERAMLAAWAAHVTLIGTRTAAQIRDACVRALSEPSDQMGTGLSEISEYLACRTAVVSDSPDLVEPVITREDGGGAAGPDREVSRAALRSQLALARGDLSAAEAQALAALGLLGKLAPTALRRRIWSDLLAGLVTIRIEQARYREAEEALGQLADAGDAPTLVVNSLRVALALGRFEPAEAITYAADLGEEPVGIAAPGLSWRLGAALAHHATGDAARAVALADAQLDHARGWGCPSLIGRALIVRGVIDPGPERLRYLEDAVAAFAPTQARLEEARAIIELGAALRRARRRRTAREHLARGADLAHRCGAGALSERARVELVAAGARPRRAAFTGVDSLTASELRVAQLAAAGMTNREIALELVVSPKTVSGQLTAVYRKLDVHDRRALAAVMRDDPSTPKRTLETVG